MNKRDLLEAAYTYSDFDRTSRSKISVSFHMITSYLFSHFNHVRSSGITPKHIDSSDSLNNFNTQLKTLLLVMKLLRVACLLANIPVSLHNTYPQSHVFQVLFFYNKPLDNCTSVTFIKHLRTEARG